MLALRSPKMIISEKQIFQLLYSVINYCTHGKLEKYDPCYYKELIKLVNTIQEQQSEELKAIE